MSRLDVGEQNEHEHGGKNELREAQRIAPVVGKELGRDGADQIRGGKAKRCTQAENDERGGATLGVVAEAVGQYGHGNNLERSSRHTEKASRRHEPRELVGVEERTAQRAANPKQQAPHQHVLSVDAIAQIAVDGRKGHVGEKEDGLDQASC